MTDHFVETKTLSAPLRDALKAVGYGGTDIRLEAQSSVSLQSSGSAGSRGFVMAVNLETGGREMMRGSWGGQNMFVTSVVDDSRGVYVLPAHGAIIKGSTGYPRTFATLYVHPDQMARFLPAAPDDLSAIDQQALYCFCHLKGGTYRVQRTTASRCRGFSSRFAGIAWLLETSAQWCHTGHHGGKERLHGSPISSASRIRVFGLWVRLAVSIGN